MKYSFKDKLKSDKVLIGMIHLSGRDSREKVSRALEEIKIYSENGLDAAIIEDYHGSKLDVENTLSALNSRGHQLRKESGLFIGANVLSNPYLSFIFADRYNLDFVQFDTIQSSYGHQPLNKRFDENKYSMLRENFPNVFVLGGVRFKYVPPTGKSLEEDLADGRSKANAIVTTGDGTGIITPTEKLRNFRKVLGDYPLIVGAGVDNRNIVEQMEICNGAIIGSYFKDGVTHNKVIPEKVKTLVDLVRG